MLVDAQLPVWVIGAALVPVFLGEVPSVGRPTTCLVVGVVLGVAVHVVPRDFVPGRSRIYPDAVAAVGVGPVVFDEVAVGTVAREYQELVIEVDAVIIVVVGVIEDDFVVVGGQEQANAVGAVIMGAVALNEVVIHRGRVAPAPEEPGEGPKDDAAAGIGFRLRACVRAD